MKKPIAFVLCVLMVISISACGIGPAEPEQILTEQVLPETTEPEQTKIQQPEQTPIPKKEPEPTPEPRKDCDFRNLKWGDSAETVMEFETAAYIESVDGTLCFSDTICGLPAELQMYFTENYGLSKVYYLFESELFPTENIFDAECETVIAAYTKVYGEPSFSESGIDPYIGDTITQSDWYHGNTHICVTTIKTKSFSDCGIAVLYEPIEIELSAEIDTSGI